MTKKRLSVAVIVVTFGLAPLGAVAETQPRGQELVALIGTGELQIYRDQLNEVANTFFEVASVRQNRRAQLIAAEFAVRAEQLTDEELAMFMASGADLGDLQRAVRILNQRVTEVQSFQASSDRLDFQEPSSRPSNPSFGGTLPSAPYSGTCGSTRMNTDAKLAAQTTLETAKGVWSAASRGCDQVAVAAGFGGNTSLACIVADGILAAAEVVYGGFLLCDDDIDSAEIKGSYDRSGHIHDNLASHDSNIDTDLAAHDANIDGDLAAHDTNIDTDLAAHDANIDTDLAAHDANIDGDLAAHDTNIDGDLVAHGTALANHDANIDADLVAHNANIDADLAAHDTNIDTDLVAHNTNLNAHNLNIETRLAAHDLNIDTDLQTHDADMKNITGDIQDTLDHEIELRRVHLQVLEIPNQKKYLLVATEGGQPVDVDFLGIQVFNVQAVNFASLAGVSVTNVEQGIYLMEVDLHALGPDRIFRIQVRHNDVVDHFGELLFRRTGDSPQSPPHPPRTR